MPAPLNCTMFRSPCTRAKSSASPALSAPDAPKRRAPSFGADVFDSGKIIVERRARSKIRSPRCHRLGIGLVPEDRKQQALFLALAIRTNLSIASHDRISAFALFHQRDSKEEALVDEYRKLLNIRMASGDQLVGNLSGGNQQKVVLARWLALRPKVLIVDEPTRGIDVGAKVEVHNLLFQMAAPALPSSSFPRNCRKFCRLPTGSSPCAKAVSPVKSSAPTRDQEKLMTLMTLSVEQAA